MIDPWNPTDFLRGRDELTEFFVYCATVSATPPDEAAERTHRLWWVMDFRSIMADPTVDSRRIQRALMTARTSRYATLRFTYEEIAKRLSLDPDWLSRVDMLTLEKLPGVGRFTARYFLLHSRENQRIAALNARVLWWMKEEGGMSHVPRLAPKEAYIYNGLQADFIKAADEKAVSCAEMDVHAWARSKTTGASFARGMWDQASRYAGGSASARAEDD